MTDTVQLASPRIVAVCCQRTSLSVAIVGVGCELPEGFVVAVHAADVQADADSCPVDLRRQDACSVSAERRVRTFAPPVVAGAMGGSVVSGFFQIEAIAFDPGSTDHNLHDAEEKP